MTKTVKLALEDGSVFSGESFGAPGEVDGEVVFNTSMTGYQEILTDPSYRGQIVAMTYPEIGNYGVNAEDVESGQPHLAGFVVRQQSRRASSFRSEGLLDDYLKRHGVVGLAGVDTRALVRRIRDRGAAVPQHYGRGLREHAGALRQLADRGKGEYRRNLEHRALLSIGCGTQVLP